MSAIKLSPTYSATVNAIAELYLTRRRQPSLRTLVPALAQWVQANQEHNRLESGHLNVFRFMRPGEITHSRLLAFFLDAQAAHGQGTLFLTQFLKQIDICEPSCGPWLVTAEAGRVDVLLRRAHPHAVVVIENKSNYAPDQPNQLYRYWHKQIYLAQLARKCSAAERQTPSRTQYRVIYLAPAVNKQPDSHAICRPDGWELKWPELPSVVPLGLVEHHQFGLLIVAWLTACLAQLPPNNHRLRQFTQQYLQFWQTL
ncbi:PD-(D/E)XK nuclease family protein [Hymenobacter sp. BT683]|uniref:PD-(D/E)XK nuclease family protein n=1 Tax=Hymenobacter jeongseonensis TaxID=2791027 RepID=A0ABS0IMC7_9BACT|nr:PD-(D/E)XK nuclease family protein [Hymenobacter jeongseonensis]MBF9239515.1 PD-(D/E)XK nuclease family protein [Hymenobacter jeongseonensis]